MSKADKVQCQVEFGQRMREVRRGKKLTLRGLSERSGLHWTYLGQVERGERNVSLIVILRIAKALEVDPGVLLKGMRL